MNGDQQGPIVYVSEPDTSVTTSPPKMRRRRQLPSVQPGLSRTSSQSSSCQDIPGRALSEAQALKEKASKAIFSEAVGPSSKGINVAGVQALIAQLLSPSDDMHPHGVFSPRTVTMDHAQMVLDMLDFDQDGVWSWDEFHKACELLLDESGNPSSYRRSILMADDIILQRTLEAKELEVQELMDRIDIMREEYEHLIEDLRRRLQERDSENYTILDQANTDIETLQQQIKVLRQQVVRAKAHQDAVDEITAEEEDLFTPAKPRQRQRIQPQPPLPQKRSQESITTATLELLDTKDALALEVEGLKKKLADRNERVLALKDDLAEASSVILEFSEKISKKDQELFELQRKNMELQNELDELHVRSLTQHLHGNAPPIRRQVAPQYRIISSGNVPPSGDRSGAPLTRRRDD
eukprot:m.145435 g.145435  ORF g.145435 m.145435 type:complete len:409 (+) comp16064_c0_seq7:254-1480(+)